MDAHLASRLLSEEMKSENQVQILKHTVFYSVRINALVKKAINSTILSHQIWVNNWLLGSLALLRQSISNRLDSNSKLSRINKYQLGCYIILSRLEKLSFSINGDLPDFFQCLLLMVWWVLKPTNVASSVSAVSRIRGRNLWVQTSSIPPIIDLVSYCIHGRGFDKYSHTNIVWLSYRFRLESHCHWFLIDEMWLKKRK